MSALSCGEHTPRIRFAWALAASVALHAVALAQAGPFAVSLRDAFQGIPDAIELVWLKNTEPLSSVDQPAATGEPLRMETAETTEQASPRDIREGAVSPADTHAIVSRPGGQMLQYFPPSELDRKPAALEDSPAPDLRAAPPGSGRVALRLLINERGQVDQALIDESEPRGVFDQWAVIALLKSRFAPGIRKGEPVKSQLRIELRVDPDHGSH